MKTISASLVAAFGLGVIVSSMGLAIIYAPIGTIHVLVVTVGCLCVSPFIATKVIPFIAIKLAP